MEEKNLDKEALISVYKNAHIALQSISDVIGATDDGKMKEELSAEYDGYEKFIGKLSSFMTETGVERQDINFIQKAFMYTSLKMNTLTELAELLNNHGKDLGEKVRALTEELKKLEESYEERLKKLV